MPTLEEIIAGTIKAGLGVHNDQIIKSIEYIKTLAYKESMKEESNLDVLELDAATARDNVPFDKVGNYIVIEEYYSTSKFEIKLNSRETDSLNLARIPVIRGSFYRFFISNPAGNGSIRLIVCRGIIPEVKPIALEEIANRIIFNTPMSFDQRGQILWADNFEGGIIKWSEETQGSGASVSSDTTTARSGSKCCKLVTGNVTNDYGHIERLMPYPVLSKFGFELSFTVDGRREKYHFALITFDGSTRRGSRVILDSEASTLSYIDSDGNEQVFATSIGLRANDKYFHTAKLVVDHKNSKYVRLILDNIVYDLSAYATYPTDSSVAALLVARFKFETTEDDNHTCYVDDAIITQNEP